MSIFVGLSVAVLGVLSGLTWHFDWVRSIDLAIFHKINTTKLWATLDRLIAIVRWLGTKWTLMVYLGIVMLWRFEIGATLTAAALITTGIESGVKLLLKRQRPFVHDQETILRQDPIPKDPGFPSGDATRVWFIFITLALGLSPSVEVIFLAALCALCVSYGRIRLGVHYPLDVWAGSTLGFGLGLAWAGIFL